MGKASKKRKKARREYFGQLAREKPAEFKIEWSKRLESWAKVARRQARNLIEKNGNPEFYLSAIIKEVIKELAACGKEALKLEQARTIETMQHVCLKAFARAIDTRLYRLTNSGANQRRMERGTHKPPR